MVVFRSFVEAGSDWWSESVADRFPGYKQVELALVTVENATGFSNLPKSVFSSGLLFSSIATPSLAMEFDQ
jgi:hypothetical protein